MPYAQLWREIACTSVTSNYVPHTVFVQLYNVWIDIIVYLVTIILIVMSYVWSTVFLRVLFRVYRPGLLMWRSVCFVAVSELRSVCTGFKLQRPGLNPWFIHVAFVLVEVTLEHVSVRLFSFTLLVVITPITHTHIGLFGTVEKDALSHPPHKPKTYRSVKRIIESTQLFLL